MKCYGIIFVFITKLLFVQSQGVGEWPDCNPQIVTWHPHPFTCTKYVLCYYGNPIERLCAPGLHFNRRTEQCMLPQLAQCEENDGCPIRDDEFNPVFLPNPEDCSAYFVCFERKQIPRNCAAGLWWDVVFNWCTIGEEVTCDSRVPNNPNQPTVPTPTLPPPTQPPPTLPPPTIPPPTQPLPTQPPPTIPPPTTPPTTTTTRNPNTMDCPLSSDPSFHPHTRDCRLYFICINGIAFLRECAAGTLFDIIERKCYDEDFATCISGTITDPDLDNGPSFQPGRFSCPLQFYDQILVYPHLTRCDRYYVCEKGIAYLHTCEDGQHYDVPSEQCDAKSKAKCLLDL